MFKIPNRHGWRISFWILICHSLVWVPVAMGVSPATAAAAQEDTPFSRAVKLSFTALKDDKLEIITTETIKINSPAVISQAGEFNIPFNDHFFDFEILEAETIKADGKCMPVAPDKIMTSSLQNAPVLGVFLADVKTRTIVFPDVAVGDTVRYVARTRERVHALAGGFTIFRTMPPSMRFSDAEISLDVPEAITLHKSIVGLIERMETDGDRRRYTWTLHPRAYEAQEPGSTAPVDRDPHVIVSSYAGWETIGQAFFSGAAPASVPVPEIWALAEDITRGIAGRREQTQAIFEYVSKHIRYVAVILGLGGYVPHDAVSILSNKYGDCKDQVTLMRALLAARGIDADYALINLAATYNTFGTPAPEWFNHVILYIPELDLYADPTDKYASFAMLSDNEADKPVLRVGLSGVTMTRTPPLSASTNRLSIKADVKLWPDGTATGTSVTEGSGATAFHLRSSMAEATLKSVGTFASELLAKYNLDGTASLDLRDPTDHSDPYVVRATFNLRDRFLGEDRNKYFIPIGPLLANPVHTAISAFVTKKFSQDFVCQAGTFEEAIDLHLPDGYSLASTPKEIHIETPLASYQATYSLSEDALHAAILHVARTLVIRVPGQVCTASRVNEMMPVIQAAGRDFQYRPRYKTAGKDEE